MALFEDSLPYRPFGRRTLRLESPVLTGTDVKALQTLYNQLLAVTHPAQGPIGAPVARDGVFGPQTQAAVRHVQSYFGLAVDGVVGPRTYLAFGQGVDGHVTFAGPAFGSRTLSQGDSGGDVAVLQNRLNLFRYAFSLGGPADGVYGPRTARAVAQLKADAVNHGDSDLAVDGTLGPAGLDAIWVYTYTGGRDLAQGSAGLDAAVLQLLLANLSNPGTGRPFYSGAVDGFFGAGTDSAVRAFQTSVGITADGVAGPATYHHIGLHNPVAAPAPVPAPPVA